MTESTHEDIEIIAGDNRVQVKFRRGPFPWARFFIACVLFTVVWFLLVPFLIDWLELFLGFDSSEYHRPIRLYGAPIFLTIYFLVTFHGFYAPGDGFSYFMSSAFHHFDVEANLKCVVIRKYWLMRTSKKTIPIQNVDQFAIDDGWFVCQTNMGNIVICDGPPSAVIQPPIESLNRIIDRAS